MRLTCDACTVETERWYYWPATPLGDKARLCEACYDDVQAWRLDEIIDRYVKNQKAQGSRSDPLSLRLEGSKRLNRLLAG